MGTNFLGEIRNYSFNYPPKGWATCNGQLLAINQNQALFALLGTTYGGNGQTTFALPNLQGRTSLHFGTSTTGVSYTQGQLAGEASHTLVTAEMPAHTHPAAADTAVASVNSPSGAFPASLTKAYNTPSPGSPTTLGTGSTVNSGGQAHSNQSPYLTLNVCIALQGIFPSRN